MAKSKDLFISLPEYWDGIEEALGARLTSSKKYLRHPAAAFSAEGRFKKLLRVYLPKRYAVEAGFVMNASGQRSQHLDIIIADTFHIPPLCSEPAFKVFAAEAVCAALEITTSPRSREKGVGKFEKDLCKLSGVRALCAEREYFDMHPVPIDGKTELRPQSFTLAGSPRCFMITSGDEWQSADTYQRNMVSALKKLRSQGKKNWLNAALSLQHGLLMFRPYTAYEGQWQKSNGLLKFLLLLNHAVTTFSTFKVDIRRYAKALPDV